MPPQFVSRTIACPGDIDNWGTMKKSFEKRKWVKPNLRIEADYILRRARENSSRIVTLGTVVLFSTTTGDAWMLDADGNLALCLSRNGQKQPFRMVETAENVAVEWDREFHIEGDLFTTVCNNTGRISSVTGYPTEEISKAIDRISIDTEKTVHTKRRGEANEKF
jgi:hypothetical protein